MLRDAGHASAVNTPHRVGRQRLALPYLLPSPGEFRHAKRRPTIAAPIAKVTYFIALGIAALVQAVYIGASVAVNRVGFDTAYNLSVSRNLGNGQGYVSDGILVGVVSTPFDVRVSTGPTLLGPLALGYVDGADGLFTARLLACIPYIALVVGLWFVGRTLVGPWTALAVTFAPLLMNMTGAFGWAELTGPTDILGEITTLAFIIWALFVCRRGSWRAVLTGGLLVGFAILTKTIAVVALPAILVTVVIAARSANPLSRILRGAGAMGIAFVPMAVWQFVILLSLGRTEYRANLAGQIDFLRAGGSGIDQAEAGAVNAAPFLESWHVAPWLFSAILAATALSGAVTLGRITAGGSASAWTSPRADRFALGSGMIVGAGAWCAWWIFFANRDFSRAVYPGAVLLAAVAITALCWSARWLLPATAVSRTAASIVVGVVIAVPALLTVYTTVRPQVVTLETQREIASAIGDASSSFVYVGGGRATLALDPHSIAAAGNLRAIPYDQRTSEDVVFLTDAVNEEDRPRVDEELALYCESVRLRAHGVIVCDAADA